MVVPLTPWQYPNARASSTPTGTNISFWSFIRKVKIDELPQLMIILECRLLPFYKNFWMFNVLAELVFKNDN